MSLNQDFTAILSKEMNRKDFIKHIGVGLVALTGLTAVIKALAPTQTKPSQVVGYGASVYGGTKNRSI